MNLEQQNPEQPNPEQPNPIPQINEKIIINKVPENNVYTVLTDGIGNVIEKTYNGANYILLNTKEGVKYVLLKALIQPINLRSNLSKMFTPKTVNDFGGKPKTKNRKKKTKNHKKKTQKRKR